MSVDKCHLNLTNFSTLPRVAKISLLKVKSKNDKDENTLFKVLKKVKSKYKQSNKEFYPLNMETGKHSRQLASELNTQRIVSKLSLSRDISHLESTSKGQCKDDAWVRGYEEYTIHLAMRYLLHSLIAISPKYITIKKY